jgi:hypothetical protein
LIAIGILLGEFGDRPVDESQVDHSPELVSEIHNWRESHRTTTLLCSSQVRKDELIRGRRAIVHSASGGISVCDAGFRRIALIRRLVDATSAREAICGANSDDIGSKN